MKFVFLSSHAHYVLDPNEKKTSGGAELQVALLALELARRGHDVTIISGDQGQEDGVIHQGVKTRTGGRFHTGKLLDAATALPVVFCRIWEEKPDFVALLGWTTWLFFLLVPRRVFRYALVFICGLDSEVNGEFRRTNPVRGCFFEYAVRHSDFRFAMSLYQAQHFRAAGQACGFYRNLVLPRAEPWQNNKTYDFLWVSRCQPIKQPHLFLDLVDRLPDRSFCMICPDEDKELWQAVSRRSATLSNLEFHRSVPYHQIQSFYDRAAVFVNTSSCEGYPNSFIQAGLGRSAILSLTVDPDGLLGTMGAGICTRGDFVAFCDAAHLLMSSPDRLHSLQDRAERCIAEWHDNESNVSAFLAGLGRIST